MTKEELDAALRDNRSAWVDVDDPTDVCLDGRFSLTELEAIVAFMKSNQPE